MGESVDDLVVLEVGVGSDNEIAVESEDFNGGRRELGLVAIWPASQSPPAATVPSIGSGASFTAIPWV